jgi:hypothetical protein
MNKEKPLAEGRRIMADTANGYASVADASQAMGIPKSTMYEIIRREKQLAWYKRLNPFREKFEGLEPKPVFKGKRWKFKWVDIQYTLKGDRDYETLDF